MKKRVLVTGANGFQGGAVVNELLVKKYAVRILSRRGETVRDFPEGSVEVVAGDYSDVSGLTAALRNVDYVFLTYPVQYDMKTATAYCSAFITAAKKSKVKMIVYNTSAWYPDRPTDVLLQEIRRTMETAFTSSGLPFVIFRPTLYLNNFLGSWSINYLLNKGILEYPLPADQVLAWTTHELLAAYTVSTFERPRLIGKRFDVGSYLLTGNSIAHKLSNFLGRPVMYKPVSPSYFEQTLASQAGPEIARQVAESYRYLYDHPHHYQTDTSLFLSNELFIEKPSFQEWLEQQVRLVNAFSS